MRILLDTHLLLWWLEASPSLPAQAREMISAPANTIFVSAVSLWEIWLEAEPRQTPAAGRLHRKARRRIFREPAPHGLTDQTGLWTSVAPSRIPFDRMLVVQAQVEKLVLPTADEAPSAYGPVAQVAR